MYESREFSSGRLSPLSVKTSSSSIGIEVMSSVAFESRDTGLPPANSGAGGSGRLGLPGRPPYLDDGVPGRGLPFKSAGSYELVEAGGRT